MPRSIVYIEIIFGAFIIAQIVTGKFAYRHNILLRKERPRAFWLLVGFELYMVMAVVSFQVDLDALGMVLGGALSLAILGFMLWALYTVITGIPEIVRKAKADPKEFWRAMFWGNR